MCQTMPSVTVPSVPWHGPQSLIRGAGAFPALATLEQPDRTLKTRTAIQELLAPSGLAVLLREFCPVALKLLVLGLTAVCRRGRPRSLLLHGTQDRLQSAQAAGDAGGDRSRQPDLLLNRGWLVTLARRRFLPVAAILVLTAPAWAEMKDVPHPYLLWTKEEAAAIRQRVETDPLAKKQYERMVAIETGKASNPGLFNLFKYSVLGDAQAGETEKRALLGFIGRRPPQNRPGNPSTGNAGWRRTAALRWYP